MKKKTIALVSHDGKKLDMIEWANYNRESLAKYNLIGTFTTSTRIKNATGLDISYLEPKEFSSGPSGGDLLLAAEILKGNIDVLIFFIDPTTVHPHADDIAALQRVTALKNIDMALNRKTADSILIALTQDETLETQ